MSPGTSGRPTDRDSRIDTHPENHGTGYGAPQRIRRRFRVCIGSLSSQYCEDMTTLLRVAVKNAGSYLSVKLALRCSHDLRINIKQGERR
jgi:hypothetical protein